jgi:two-component system sensor histidine kinase RpfC
VRFFLFLSLTEVPCEILIRDCVFVLVHPTLHKLKVEFSRKFIPTELCMRDDKLKPAMLQTLYRYAGGKRDSELEQSVVRILISIGLVAYLLHQSDLYSHSDLYFSTDFILVIMTFLVIATGMSVYIAVRPGNVPVRRVVAILLDVGTLTYLFLRVDSYAAPLYFLYLWIIIGYGFRFGNRYLFLTLFLSLAGFGATILEISFWSDQLTLSLGLWMGMLLISVYLSTLVGRLYRALDHAEVANRAKRQFISSVSHELRTPLNAIIGMVDLLKGTELDREQQDMLDCMSTTSQVMLSQIEDVLDFSKIEAGKMAVEQSDFDLYQLVFGIVDIFRYHVDAVVIEFLTSIACDVPYALRGDPHHLRQILVNLFANAVKFTERGRITIRIRKIRNQDDGVRLRFSVIDTGVGIAPDAQNRIFESFTQADETTARRYGGTGLGTTICQQLVELMHGKIGFSSELGVGSEFWFELDMKVSKSIPQPKSNSARLRPIYSMIISADTKYLPLVADLLEQCSAPVQMEDDFQAALGRLEQSFLSGKPVRLIVLDLEMSKSGRPLTDYRELLREHVLKLRAAANDSPVSLILLMPEGLTEESADKLAEEAGFSGLLPTPIDRLSLHNILHAHELMVNAGVVNKIPSAPLPVPNTLGVINLKQRVDPERYHILVAEDNPTNRKVLQKILERAGHRCTLAKDGEEALDLIEKKEFDAIVLDMNMPIMTGLDVARTYCVMRSPSLRAPMIMFSANVTLDAKEESLEAGADEFLPKPIQIEHFLNTLDRLVAQYKAGGTLPLSTAIEI